MFTHGYLFGHTLWQDDHWRTSPLCFNWHLCFLLPEHLDGRSEKLQWNIPEFFTSSKGNGFLTQSVKKRKKNEFTVLKFRNFTLTFFIKSVARFSSLYKEAFSFFSANVSWRQQTRSIVWILWRFSFRKYNSNCFM